MYTIFVYLWLQSLTSLAYYLVMGCTTRLQEKHFGYGPYGHTFFVLDLECVSEDFVFGIYSKAFNAFFC